MLVNSAKKKDTIPLANAKRKKNMNRRKLERTIFIESELLTSSNLKNKIK